MQELDQNDPRTLADGRYELLGILGEGSMGRTYLAQGESGRVAIKALYPSRLATAKDLELFVREAEVLQKLSHPRIPAYIDAFEEGEGEGIRYHLVQEFVDGATLRAAMARGDRYDEAAATKMLRQLLALLLYLHGCDPPVVHRDIKPENIMLRAPDSEPALVDFGAVREVVRLTMGGGSTIIGTYGYMPPEQLMGRALPASDIYSTGITILELLTRETPQDLHGHDVQRLVAQANVSEPFRRVLRRMCAPSLAERYAAADQILADLDALSGGGALVHAGALEASITERKKDEERALKKSSTPGIVHVGYIALIGIIVLGVLTALGILFNMLASGFETAFLFALATSGAGILITFILLGLRYTHDAWEPPGSGWTKTRARVLGHEEIYVDTTDNQHQFLGWGVRYGFPTARGEHQAVLSVTTNERDLYPEGLEFDVYFRQNNPEWHEMQDIRHDPDDAMKRLFNPGVVHTPE